MRVSEESMPVIMNSVLDTHKLFVHLEIIDGMLIDANHGGLLDTTIASINTSGGIYHTPEELLTFAQEHGIDLSKHVAYDIQTGKLGNVTEDEYNLLINL